MRKMVWFFGVMFLGALGYGAPSAVSVMKSLSQLPASTKGRCLKEGSRAPQISLPTINGGRWDLKERLKEGPSVLVFYRGGWCPYCNIQLRQYEKVYAKMKPYKAQMVAISVDRPDPKLLKDSGSSLSFSVASDTQLKALSAFNLKQKLSADMVEKYKNWDIDIEGSSGKKHHVIAVPALVVVDQKGVVRFCYASENYKVRPAGEVLLHKLKEIEKSS